MRTHLRNGVAIDQCGRCYGIFLDRGEFERLLAAEQSMLGRP
jgi:Zn-finger nucleic acid-binding protein